MEVDGISESSAMLSRALKTMRMMIGGRGLNKSDLRSISRIKDEVRYPLNHAPAIITHAKAMALRLLSPQVEDIPNKKGKVNQLYDLAAINAKIDEILIHLLLCENHLKSPESVLSSEKAKAELVQAHQKLDPLHSALEVLRSLEDQLKMK